MSRNIPRVQVWRVTVYWDKPEGTTISECRHYYVNAPNKRFAWWNVRDEILVDVGAARFIQRDRVTIGLIRRKPEQRSAFDALCTELKKGV